jgi:hypothetical protein
MVKLLLTYRDEEDRFCVESVWANPEAGNYRIDNIPFFAGNKVSTLVYKYNPKGFWLIRIILKPCSKTGFFLCGLLCFM